MGLTNQRLLLVLNNQQLYLFITNSMIFCLFINVYKIIYIIAESGVVLDRRFIACILASAFLCALPPSPVSTKTRSINFVSFFSCFHRYDVY